MEKVSIPFSVDAVVSDLLADSKLLICITGVEMEAIGSRIKFDCDCKTAFWDVFATVSTPLLAGEASASGAGLDILVEFDATSSRSALPDVLGFRVSGPGCEPSILKFVPPTLELVEVRLVPNNVLLDPAKFVPKVCPVWDEVMTLSFRLDSPSAVALIPMLTFDRTGSIRNVDGGS